MKKLGKKQLTLGLQEPLNVIPGALAEWRLALNAAGTELVYRFDASDDRADIPALMRRISELGIAVSDLSTQQSSLEDIFVSLVSERPEARL